MISCHQLRKRLIVLVPFIRQYERASLRKTFSADHSKSYAMLNIQPERYSILKGQMNEMLKGKPACYSTLSGRLVRELNGILAWYYTLIMLTPIHLLAPEYNF